MGSQQINNLLLIRKMKFAALIAIVSGAAIQFQKGKTTKAGTREANEQEVKMENWVRPHRAAWGSIDQLYREVLGMNTDQVIPFRNGEHRPIANIKMSIISGEPSNEMRIKALVAAQRGALMNYPKD